MATTNILHLSDLHFGDGNPVRGEVLRGLLKALRKLEPGWQPRILVMSGDLTCKGNPAGYTQLNTWLTSELFPLTSLTPQNCVICPGNHDIDRKVAKYMIGRTDKHEEADDLLNPDGLPEGPARAFREFEKFAIDLGIVAPKLKKKDNYLCGVHHIGDLRFACANTAWFCRDSKTDEGKLWLGLPQLREMELGDPDDYDTAPITLAVIHHPRDFLHLSDRAAYSTRMGAHGYLALRSHAVLSGHSHAKIQYPEPDRFQGRAWHLGAGATFDNHQYRNNFAVLQIEGRHLTRRIWEYDPGAEEWEEKRRQELSLKASAPSSTPPSPDAEAYLAWLRTETSTVDLLKLTDAQSIPKPAEMDDLYARLMTGASGEGVGMEAGQPRRVPLDEALKHQRLQITGDAGTGKSTFLRRVAWAICRPPSNPERLLNLPHLRFPIFVRIRELDTHISETKGGPADASDPAWLVHFMAKEKRWGLDETFWRNQLRQPGTVLLIDGLDEAANSDRRASLVNLVDAIAKQNPSCHIVVTTRPIDLKRKEEAGWNVAQIAPLDETGIKEFLWQWARWLKPDNESAAGDYLNHMLPALLERGLRDLAANPLMLTCLAMVYMKGEELPKHRAGLYERIVVWLAEQAQKRNPSYSDKYCLEKLGDLALGMQMAPGGHLLEIDEDRAAKLIAPQRSQEQAKEFLTHAHLNSGILTLRSGGKLAFWHRGFQEYLAARALGQNLDHKERLPIATALLYSPEGREVLPLVPACLVESKLCQLLPELIKDALSQKALDQRAHAVGVLGRMFADMPKQLAELAPDAAAPYQSLRDSVMGIFKKGIAASIGVETRAAAAEALDQADPRARLYTPREDNYWSPVLSGAFTIGGDKAAFQSLPKERVTVERFRIGIFPVTVWEYAEYLKEKPHNVEPPEDWEDQLKHLSRPVINVDWNVADRYCRHFDRCHLPTEKQWEFAARGTASRSYPWEGNAKPGEPLANCQNILKAPSPVGIFPDGDTPEGVSDMLGNVWEWTSSELETGRYSVRGASFLYVDARILRAAARFRLVPDVRDGDLGFRCVREVIP